MLAWCRCRLVVIGVNDDPLQRGKGALYVGREVEVPHREFTLGGKHRQEMLHLLFVDSPAQVRCWVRPLFSGELGMSDRKTIVKKFFDLVDFPPTLSRLKFCLFFWFFLFPAFKKHA